MSKERPKGESMSVKEATVSNMWEIAAIVEVVERKGLCTKHNLYDIITEFRRKNPRASISDTTFPEPYLLTETENKIITTFSRYSISTGSPRTSPSTSWNSWAGLLRWGSGWRRGRRTNKEATMGSRGHGGDQVVAYPS
jgi:hypothetical protein